MTLEEKIAHLQASSMENARAESNAIIDSHRDALEKLYQDHKEEALRQSETRIKSETIKAKQDLNKAMAKTQLEIKRKQGTVQQELKDKLFKEVYNLTDNFMKTEAYEDLLIQWIKQALEFAGGTENVIIYINPSDEPRQSDLRDATGVNLIISREEFIGGIRAVIHDRNILIDHSFKTNIDDEYAKFIFLGGDGRE
ncbi:MAG: V-type ATP synthase subunit E [Hespellia sp.]|nr:V-type ATP synthase subunit E [Hespellia sp.]